MVLYWFEWNLPSLSMQLTDWLLVEEALLLIDLTKISLTKSGFNHPSAWGQRQNRHFIEDGG